MMKRTKHTTCPTCKQSARFTAVGEQRWPAAVAAAHGLPQVITLWTCSRCHTTISETDFPQARLCPAPVTAPG